MQRKVKIESVSALNSAQQKFLLDELHELTGWKGPLKKELPPFVVPRKPPYIKQYEHKIAKLKAAHERQSKEHRARYAVAVSEVKRAIHFGTADDALAAIEKLRAEFS